MSGFNFDGDLFDQDNLFDELLDDIAFDDAMIGQNINRGKPDADKPQAELYLYIFNLYMYLNNR